MTTTSRSSPSRHDASAREPGGSFDPHVAAVLRRLRHAGAPRVNPDLSADRNRPSGKAPPLPASG